MINNKINEIINVLIVEDNEDDLFFIKKALTNDHYKFKVIESGFEAYKYLQKPDIKPDIVLLDNKLPGMNGLEILQKICEENNDYGFIFLTVDNTINTVVEAMKAGALDFIVKSSELKNELPEKIEKVYQIHQNKVERKRIEEELIKTKVRTEENEKKYKMLFNTITEGVALNEMIYNEKHEMIDYRIIEVNRAYCSFTNLSPEQVLNKLASEIYNIPEESIKTFWKQHKEVNETVYTEMHRPANNKYFYNSTSPFVNDKFVTVFFDITSLKEAENALINAKEIAEKNQENYMNAILDLNKAQSIAKVGSWKWYIQENQLEWSKEMYRIFEIDEETFTGNLDDVIKKAIHPEDKSNVEASNKSAAEKGLPIPLEYRIIVPDGKVKIVWAEAGELIKDKNSKPLILSGIVQDITDRKKAEEELTSRTRALESIFESAPYIMMLLDKQAKVVDLNGKGVTFTGRKKEDLLGLLAGEVIKCLNSFEGEGCGKNEECLTCPILTQLNHTIETYEPVYEAKGSLTVDRKGEILKLELLISTTLIKIKNETDILLTIADITDRVLMEEALRMSEERLQSIFLAAPTGIGVVKDRILNRINPKIIEMTGYSNEELIGKSSRVLYPSQKDFEYVGQEKYGLMSEKGTGIVETKWMKKDGTIIDILLSSTPIDPDDPQKGITFTALDITDRKQSEIALRQSEDNYKRFMDDSTLGIRIINTKGKTLYVNKALLEIYGFGSFQEFQDTPVINRYTEKEIQRHQLRKAKRKKGEELSSEYEIEITRKNGEIRNLHVIRKETVWNKTLHYQVIYQDITDRKKAEEALLVAKEKAEESDHLKSAFLQNMSHEIRTPMNAIIGFSSLLDNPDMTKEKQQNYVSIIKNSSNQLLSVVTDILTISSIDTKQEKTNITKVFINDIIDDLNSIFSLQAANQNIKIISTKQLSDNESELYTDKTKITQVMTNLISNALKFTTEGKIEFGYTLIKIPDEKSVIQFYVKDTGIGIKAEYHEKIFERFRQVDQSKNRIYGGNGLGLSISKGFVELLGGKIWLKSEPDKGSEFYFTIPYSPVNESIKINSFPVETYAINSILIAEDEENNFLLIKEFLNYIECKILHTKNGQETVETCKTNPDIGLILMDIKMPIMDGYIAAKLIKEFRPTLPIIAQTAYALESEIAKYEDVFDDYITKPINESELNQVLKKYIGIIDDNEL
jgi:PAS domain S-box-containing protein